MVIKTAYSSVNFKDALAGTGEGKILRSFPLVGGIDVAGHVVACTDPAFREGDAVLVTGCGLSETRDGGYAAVRAAGGEVGHSPARGPEPAREHDPGHRRLHRRAGAVPHAATTGRRPTSGRSP